MNLILSLISFWLVSFSSLSFTDTNGNTVSMSSFAGKKVMLVNIATGSPKINQEIVELQQLQQQYKDSLVIIVFPSNSFGHEPKTDAEIKQLLQGSYHTSFIIAAKSAVSGTNANTVYSWLAQKSQNGDMDAQMGNDFQKFIIGTDGRIAGMFSSKITPQDSSIINVINTTY